MGRPASPQPPWPGSSGTWRIVVSAEALFVLTDLCGLSPDDAIASAVRTATTLTKAAFADAAAS